MDNKNEYPKLPFMKLSPLISFDTILDLDTGLIELIKDQYADPDVFDLELLQIPDQVLYSLIYFRPCTNPLYTIRNKNMILNKENMELLDSYYDEFINTKYNDIVQYAKLTNMVNVINEFYKARDVSLYILYENDLDLEQLKMIDIPQDINKVYISSVDLSNTYNQIYLKYIFDLSKLPEKISNTTFYFSDCGLNITEDFNINPDGILYLKNIKKYNNEINVFNMYKENIINRIYLPYFKDKISYDIQEEDNGSL